jgi:hypothetical protein
VKNGADCGNACIAISSVAMVLLLQLTFNNAGKAFPFSRTLTGKQSDI